ncbi:MAG: hypothetical protein KW793_04140, partial [Candidatus Doudnabacteria bacterium]|nr:hypothetical protein [Candidatus Doudnabacteria bacterium]
MDIHQIILAVTETAQQVQNSIPDASQGIQSAAEAGAHKNSSGVLGTLGINWKLFLAQLINFSIVLFVFWKWVVNLSLL